MNHHPDASPALRAAIDDAERILREAIETHLDDRTLVGAAVLFSGGNDSATLLHLMAAMGAPTHVIHANTTIGIEATRQFVRDQTAAHGLPLLEETPPVSYRDLVLAQGFPGPAHHFKMYQRLKDRALRQARRRLVTNGRRERVLFIAGRRRAESARRTDVPEHERVDSVIWASPLANWETETMAEYRALHAVPRNPVADALGMSGECLCGAFAEPGELDRIGHHHPEVAAEIHALEAEVIAAGTVPEERCMWGWGAYRGAAKPSKSGPLCSSCDFRSDPAARLNLSPEETTRVRETHARIMARRAARTEGIAA